MVSLAPALLPVAALVLGAATVSPALPAPPQADTPTQVASPVRSTVPGPARPAAGTTARSTAPPSSAPRQGWRWPLEPQPTVARHFERPASTWGAGHRGIDLAATSGQPVLATAAGRVVHVGVIAGRGTVSVLHADGIRTTYEPVTARVHGGQVVRAGQVIGLVDGSAASHCTSCLHLGALRGPAYLDPLALLRPGHVVLLPLGAG